MSKVLQILLLLLVLSFSVKAQITFETVDNMKNAVSEENIKEHIRILSDAWGYKSRVALTPGADSAAQYIYDQFKFYTQVDTVYKDTFYVADAPVPYDTIPMYNVVAEIYGKGPVKTLYLFGAHYDASASRESGIDWDQHWATMEAPGADDNATGVAAIIEMARVMSDPQYGFEPKHGIRFVAFGAEEYGPAHGDHHVGSRHHAKLSKERGESILGMVSIDMIGYNNDYDFNSIVSDANSQWFAQKIYELNGLFNVELMLDEPPYSYATYSDHEAFWGEGFDAILFIEYAPPWNNGTYYDRNYYYHTSGDTAGTVNNRLVKKVTQLNLAAAAAFGGLLTDVDEETVSMPERFALLQNYPNPFNPSTNIKIMLPESGHASLEVYNILGEKAATIVNAYHNRGEYTYSWDAGALPGGVYFAVLRTDNYSKTIKMLLLK